MAGAEGAGGALAVDIELALAAVDDMGLLLAGVVGDIVKQAQVRPQHIPEHLACQVGDDLAIGQGAVDAGAHGAEVGAAQVGVEGGAGQLPVRQVDAVLAGGQGHALEVVGADLVPQAAGAAVDAHHHRPLLQAVGGGDGRVVDGLHLLDLQVVVAGAQGAHLVTLAALGLVGDLLGIGPGHAPLLLDAAQVLWPAVATTHRPARPAGEHGVHLPVVEADGAGAAQAHRDAVVEGVGQFLLHRQDGGPVQAGMQGAHPAGDVEADPTAGNHPALVGVEGRHPADGEAIAPVGVGHGIGGLDDARQAGDVDHLLVHLVVHVADQGFVAEEDAGDAHGALGLDAPLGVGELGQGLGVHGDFSTSG